MKRRWCSILAALALCLTLLPATALAAESSGTCGENLTWTLSEDGTLTISGSGAMADYDFSGSDRPWHAQASSIKNVVIGEGVTSIGTSAFRECGQLASVQIHESVKTIGELAFASCQSLSNITLPSGLTSIEDNLFTDCSALKRVTIPENVSVIKSQAFGSTGLTEVKIPSGVTTIEGFAFSDCTALLKVEIPQSVKSIKMFAFDGCTNATIYFKGTTAEWNDLIGSTDIGVESNKVHTSDSDHTVTIENGGTGCSENGLYSEGAAVTVNAGTMAGKAFAGWTVTGLTLTEEQAASPDLTFTMPANDVTLTANWAEAVAQVGETAYTTVQAAFDAAAAESSGTVELLKDVTVTEAVKLTSGSVILDGQGYTLTGTGLTTISVEGGSLTLENVTVKNTSEGQVLAPGAVIPGKAINVSESGNLTVSDGSAVRAEGKDGWALFYLGGQAHITIQGGTISGGEGFGFNTTGDFTAGKISLLGGTFIGRTGNAIYAPGGYTLGNLVGEGLALINNTTGEAVDLTEQYTGSGTFTVGCAHAKVGTVTSSGPDANGVVTVTAPCQKCGETVTLGTLTMVNNGLTIAYGDTPTLKVQPSEELGVTKYEWPNNGSGAEYTPNTDALSLGILTFTCKVTFADQGGTSHDVDVIFTLNVEKLNITNAKISVIQESVASNTVPYNGQGQKPAIEGFLINDNGFPSSYFDVSLVDASGEAAETQTNAGTYKIKLTGKDVLEGTVTLTSPTFTIEKATPTIKWPGDVVEQRPYTGEPVAPSLTPTVTVEGMDSYDGEAVTYSYATAEAGPYKQGLPTNPGTYYIKAAVPQQKNYTAAETAGTLKLVITKAAAEITTAPTAVNPAYNGKPQALVTAAEASVGEVQYALSADGPWSKEIPTGKNAGEYTVYYKVDETANYTGVEVQGPVKVEIKKAEVKLFSQHLSVKNNLAKDYTLDLKPFLPDLPQGQTYGELVYAITDFAKKEEDCDKYLARADLSLSGSVLTIPIKAAESDKEQDIASIEITITSDNFSVGELVILVSSTNKTPVTITGVTAQGWTYDGKPHPGYTGTPDTGGYTGDIKIMYSKYPYGSIDGEPTKAGTYMVSLSVPKDNPDYEGEIILTFTVEQAQVTIKADNKTAYVGEEMPELTYQVSGLAEDESLVTNPTPACTPDMTKAGSYPITISGGEVPAGGNYKAIIYQPGTLTVREKPAPPKPVDPKPPVDPDDLEVKLEVKEGFAEVPPALRALEHLNTPEKLTQVMRTAVTRTGVPSGNTAVYDVKLMVSTDGGRTWTPATASNFPSGGLTVTLPYPAGTDSGYTFTVVHMFTTTAFGKTPGDTESPTVTNTAQGLQFTVTGLSPISVGWKEKTTGGSSGSSGSSGGSYSGGGGSRPTSSVTVEAAEHGKVTSDRSSAGSGSPVTLTVQPDRGYQLESLTVTDSRGNKLQLTAQGGGKYAFTMSGGSVTVKAVFAPLAEDAKTSCDGGAACPSRAFTDLKSGAWYHEAVDFVLRSGLMGGYGDHSFKPDRTLTRAQFAQILYNKEGRPAGAGSAPFTDVAPDAWCAPAVAWAAERGVAGGYGGGLFGPDDAITREQLAVMLWRYAGSPAAQGGELPFADAEQIGAHAREALGWAVQTGVMNGKANGVLDPKGLATRAHAAQMLKNFLEQG